MWIQIQISEVVERAFAQFPTPVDRGTDRRVSETAIRQLSADRRTRHEGIHPGDLAIPMAAASRRRGQNHGG